MLEVILIAVGVAAIPVAYSYGYYKGRSDQADK